MAQGKMDKTGGWRQAKETKVPGRPTSRKGARVKAAEYHGLGFPVLILDPVYIEFEGEQVLDVNPRELQEYAFRALVSKPARLSGAEVRFIRNYLRYTQESFAKWIGVETSLVSKWEKKKIEFTGMSKQVELMVRMRCQLHLNKKQRISEPFIDNTLNELDTQETGEPLEIAWHG